MKKKKLVYTAVAASILLICAFRLFAAENKSTAHYEYVTIRWAGRENTHIIRPGGQVEFIGHELRKATKPERADDRSFFLNLAMNGLAKEGYEFAGISNDDIVMRRSLAP